MHHFVWCDWICVRTMLTMADSSATLFIIRRANSIWRRAARFFLSLLLLIDKSGEKWRRASMWLHSLRGELIDIIFQVTQGYCLLIYSFLFCYYLMRCRIASHTHTHSTLIHSLVGLISFIIILRSVSGIYSYIVSNLLLVAVGFFILYHLFFCSYSCYRIKCITTTVTLVCWYSVERPKHTMKTRTTRRIWSEWNASSNPSATSTARTLFY